MVIFVCHLSVCICVCSCVPLFSQVRFWINSKQDQSEEEIGRIIFVCSPETITCTMLALVTIIIVVIIIIVTIINITIAIIIFLILLIFS